MKRKHLLMGAALALAAWLALFADKTPNSGVAEPVVRANSASSRAAARPVRSTPTVVADGSASTAVMALEPRQRLIGGAHQGTGNVLFGSQNWEPPPAPIKAVKPAPAPPPSAPPLPFTYLGKQNEDGVWQVFLARGEQTFIVREASIVEGLYRVDAIKPPQLSLTYLPLKQAQTLTIGSTE